MFRPPILKRPPESLSDRAIGDLIAEKIVGFLKRKFLNREELTYDLDSVLTLVNEVHVSDGVKTILAKEVLPAHPKILFANGQVSFIPPFQIQDENDIRRLIREKGRRHEGVFEGDIEDSAACGMTMIRKLTKEEVITVERMDDKKVYFGVINDDLPKLEVGQDFKCMFHSINVRYLDPIDITKYLERRKLNPMQAAWKTVITPPLRGRKQVAKPQKIREVRIKDNQHVRESLTRFEDNKEVVQMKKKNKKKKEKKGERGAQPSATRLHKSGRKKLKTED